MNIRKHASSTRTRRGSFAAFVIAGLFAPTYPLSALAAGIAAVTGSGTGVNIQNGVPVVTIATPSGGGLSHNRYTDFNVGKEGAVLNNSLTAGASQLAGQLGANANLQGRNARVILNEVVSANSSQLLGQQEVFGQRADLVLANPNGINCNGCGFINVSQATLAVAKPNVEGGLLKSLQVSKVDASLQLDGTVNAAGTDLLRLIAPSARIGGTLKGGQQVDIVLGNNTVDASNGQVTASTNLTNTDRRYDSTLFGAMQAGRIQLLSTSAGVGVNLDAAQLNATDIALKADQLNVRGIVSQVTTKDYHYHSNWWNWGRAGREYVDQDETNTRQSIARSQLNATGSLKLEAKDALNVNAADLNGADVALSGNAVALGTQATTNTDRYYYRDAINWWYYQNVISRDVVTQNGANINASRQLNLDAVQNASLTGAVLNSQGNARLSAGNDLKLAAAINTDVRSAQENEVNNTFINNSSSTSNYNNQSLVSSRISAGGSLALNAGHDLGLSAAQLKSGGDSLLSANGTLITDAQSFKTAQAASSVFTNTGGLFGGNDSSSGSANTLYQGSDVQAGGTVYLTADGDVRVRGSRIKATNGVYAASRTGAIGVDVAKGTALSSASSSNQTVFNITTSASSSSTQQQVIKGSDLHSDADLKLISATDTTVIGSLLKAAGNIGITAAGGLTIANTTATTTTSTSSTTTQGYATGGATSEAQYQGGVGIQTVTTSGTGTSSTVAGSTVQAGGNTNLSAGQTVAVTGSTVQSGGNITATGTDVTVNAAQNTTNTQSTTSTTGGGLYATGGVDKIGAGVEVSNTTTTTTSQTSTATTSSLSAGGDITRTATGTVSDQGTTIAAGGAINTQATNVDSLAATNTSTTTTQTDSTHVELGVSGETGSGRAVYNGIMQTVTDAQNGTVTMPIPNGSLNTPTGGAALTVTSSDTTTTTTSSTDVASTTQAGSINTQASNTLTLQGTQQSATGDVSLNAGTVNAGVAESQTQTQTSGVTGTGGVAATFNVSGTLNLSTPVSAQTSNSTQSQTTQQGASISGSNVQVAATGDANLTATQVTSTGDATVSAGGNLLNTAATNTQTSTSSTQGGGGQLGVSMVVAPVPTVTGVSGSVNYQESASSSNSTQAVTGSVTAGGDAQLSSGGNLITTGTVSAGGDVSLSAGGDLVVAASRDTTHDTSSSSGVNASLSVGLSGSTATGGGGSLGFQVANDDQRSDTLSGSNVTAGGTVSLSSGGNTTLTATQVQADTVSATTGGSLTLQSAQSTATQTGSATSASIGINASQTSGSGDLKVAVSSDQVNQVTQVNAAVSANQVQVQTGENLTLAGATVTATNSVTAQVGGDLSIVSLQDVDQSQHDSTSVDLHVAGAQPQPSQPIESPILDKMGDGVKTAVNTIKTGVDAVTPYMGSGVTVKVDDSQSNSTPVTQASAITAPTVDATVQGSTTLAGGQISGSSVNLATSELNTSNVDSVIDTSATHVNLPVKADVGAIGDMVKEAIGGQAPVTLAQTQETTVVVGGVSTL